MTIFTDKVKLYNTRLEADLSVNDAQAAGIWGNLGVETGGFTALQEKNPTVKGSRGGYGWMQWTGPRRKKYEAWCQTNSLNPADDETNYKYLVHETITDESHSLVQLRKTTTVEAAAETFMKQNLRPGMPHLPARQEYAKKAYLAMQDAKKSDQQIVTTGGAVGGGLIATAATPTNYWPWIWAAVVLAAVIGYVWSHLNAEKNKEQIPTKKTTSVVKKVKKNA